MQAWWGRGKEAVSIAQMTGNESLLSRGRHREDRSGQGCIPTGRVFGPGTRLSGWMKGKHDSQITLRLQSRISRDSGVGRGGRSRFEEEVKALFWTC